MNNIPYTDDFSSKVGEQALKKANIYVTKLGGTRASELAFNVDYIEKRRGKDKKQILAISAIRSNDERFTNLTHPIVNERAKKETGKNEKGFNTTSHLILIADLINKGEFEEARYVLECINAFTKEIVNEQLMQDSHISDKETAITQLGSVIDAELKRLHEQIDMANKENVLYVGKDRLLPIDSGYYSITGVGENLARAIYVTYLQIRNQNTAELKEDNMSHEIFGDNPKEYAYDSPERDDVLHKITNAMKNLISRLLEENDILISGGYFSGVGIERGYTELTAALIAVACKQINKKVICLIEKDWPIMSSDPNTIKNTQLIERIKYKLALELFGNQTTGADSQAIHAPALDVLAQNKVDIVVFNPDKPERGTTLIQDFDSEKITGGEVIATKKIPDAIIIESGKMIVPGFLHTVGGWFMKHNISVVLPPSSQATMSLTFNNIGPTKEQIREFETFLNKRYGANHITLRSIPGQSLVYCLGHNVQNSDALVRAVLALHSIGVTPNMNMGGYTETGFVFSVDNTDLENTASVMHKFCIEQKDTPVEELLDQH